MNFKMLRLSNKCLLTKDRFESKLTYNIKYNDIRYYDAKLVGRLNKRNCCFQATMYM